jgi:ankyrin repeat protein
MVVSREDAQVQLDVMQALVDAGAEVDARADNQSTPLHWYVDGPCLLAHLPRATTSNVCLSWASRRAAGAGNTAAVSLLLALGADPFVQSCTWGSNVFGKSSGQTPGHWASESGEVEALRLLLGKAVFHPSPFPWGSQAKQLVGTWLTDLVAPYRSLQ